MKRPLTRILSIFLISANSWAQMSPPKPGAFGTVSSSDFYVGLDLGRPLIRVSIVTGVANPGIYHTPIETNLSELLSYAGGSSPKADMSNIRIRRTNPDGTVQLIPINLESLVTSKTSPLPTVQDQDIIYIGEKEVVDQTLKWLSIASLVTSIYLTVLIIEDRD